MSEPEFNPYASPQTPIVEATAIESDVEALRRECISHETSIRAMALIFLIWAIIFLVAAVSIPTMARTQRAGIGLTEMLIPVIFCLIAGVQLFVAYGLRRLNPIARIFATIFSTIGLFSFPIGTVLNAYFLYLFWSQKGNQVFAPGYKNVIEQTPHIKYKTSIIMQILMVILLCFLVLVFLPVFFSG